jgi:carboxynorspermidine decarboxylase
VILDYRALDGIETPAFAYDRAKLSSSARETRLITSKASVSLLFAIKSFCLADGLKCIAPHVDGFAVSSTFEARLARCILRNVGSIHLTSPGLRAAEIETNASVCDYVSFNSITQCQAMIGKYSGRSSCGLRLNPRLSFVDDELYDPCRRCSKLGIPIEGLVSLMQKEPEGLADIEGVHFHTNCDSANFGHLLQTVKSITRKLRSLLCRLKWINLGGGYLFQESLDLGPFYEAVGILRAINPKISIYVEPGTSIARSAGYLISRVVDLFRIGRKTIAVLDTTVNHMPEVFEYRYQPSIDGICSTGKYQCVLAGSTCLAGDTFGEYRLVRPLELNSIVVFHNMGAYSHVKWNTFNGINLPAVYALTESGEFQLQKKFTFAEFAGRNGANRDDCV